MNLDNGHSHKSSPSEVVLITGAGGSIGSALAKEVCVRAQHCCAPACHDVNPTSVLFNDRALSPNDQIRTVLLLDHSEQNLYEIHSELSSSTPHSSPQIIPILGDVNDASLLADLFEKYRPTQVFHAAAFKHVPLMEENPVAVIRNNILGTSTLATIAARHRARQLTMISTDKPANPRSIMGAAKRVAELILARLDTPATRMRSIRLGNVLGSTGSVVPLFQRQIRSGGPVTVTHPDARRYFLSLDEATDLILAAAALEDAATLFVPDLPAPIKILDLAQRLVAEAAAASASEAGNSSATQSASPANPIEIIFTGLRPGDKLSEDLLSSSESAEPTTHPKLRRILGPLPTTTALDSAITLISEKVQSRDLLALLDAILSLVPDYQPSDLVSARTSTQLSATAKA